MKSAVEGRPADLITEFDCGEHDALAVEPGQQGLEM
jgi:hypothetical protein